MTVTRPAVLIAPLAITASEAAERSATVPVAAAPALIASRLEAVSAAPLESTALDAAATLVVANRAIMETKLALAESLAEFGCGPVGLVHRQKVRFFSEENPTASP